MWSKFYFTKIPFTQTSERGREGEGCIHSIVFPQSAVTTALQLEAGRPRHSAFPHSFTVDFRKQKCGLKDEG